jgi:hypothetical protein
MDLKIINIDEYEPHPRNRAVVSESATEAAPMGQPSKVLGTLGTYCEEQGLRKVDV